MSEQQRWPNWVYGMGREPDYRFSFANERTFLAWIRTALAVLAGGVALDAIPLSMSRNMQQGLAGLLVAFALITGPLAWLRWAQAERAMRREEPLPASRVSGILAIVVVVVAVAVLVALSH